MPDIFSAYNESLQQKTPQQNPPQYDALENDPYVKPDKPQKEKGFNISGNLSADGDVQKQNEAAQYNDKHLGSFDSPDVKNDPNLPESWSPEYTMRGFFEETGVSMMRGIGNSVIKGTGDLLQVAQSWAGMDIGKGSIISRGLQDLGTDMAAQFKSYLPEELQHEEITWGSMANPKFWSIKAAEMVPQLVEAILLSKGGASLAKKGAGSLVKSALKKEGSLIAKNATKVALGNEVFGTGKGIIGKLITSQGLSGKGNVLVGAFGGGLTGNIYSGMLNAAELVNNNKDLKDKNGNLVFNEEQLSQMASGTIMNNMVWMGIDMASFGLTYGGGWKALKGLNPMARGGKVFNALQQSKIGAKMFSYSVAPAIKGLAKVAGKAGSEGLEEMFQETYEEWAKMKAEAAVSGDKELIEKLDKGYWEFFNSKENKETQVLSFALGMLGGGAGNISQIFNKKADENYRLQNRIANFTEITKNQGSEQELYWQRYHSRQTLADIVLDDQLDTDAVVAEFLDAFVENENITEDERGAYEEMVEGFKEVVAKADRLNIKGKIALLYNNNKQKFIEDQMQSDEVSTKQAIADIQADEMLTDKQKATAIKEREDAFQVRLKSASILRAEAMQNQSNLIIGKKATELNLDVKLDKYGNEMIVGGLSTQQFADYTTEGEIDAQNNPKSSGIKMPSLGNLSEKGKGLVAGIMSKFKKPTTQDEISEEQNPTGAKVETDEETETRSEEDTEFNEEEVDNKSTDDEAKANEEADAIVDDAVINDENETISDDVYEAFKEGDVYKKTLRNIAEKIYNEGELSTREEEIRAANEEAIRKEIVQKILGTQKDVKEPSKSAEPSKKEETAIKKEKPKVEKDKELTNEENDFIENEVDDELSPEELKSIQDKNGVTITQNEDGTYKVENNTGRRGKTKAKKEIQSIIDKKKNARSIEDVQAKKNAAAKEKFNFDKSKTENSENEIGMDRRAKNKDDVESKIPMQNLVDFAFIKNFRNKLRQSKITEGENISQNEIDNYLNRYTTYNLYGPSDIDKMAVVNHQLKRMFPNTKDPVQVMIVKNLFESVGSQGLGNIVASTIFVDTKAWQQDRVFMHEISHVLYRIAGNEPEVQKLLKSAMADAERVKDIKSRYDDYTLYNIVYPGGKKVEIAKRDLAKIVNDKNKEGLENFIREAIQSGELETIPFSEQRLLKEELFVSMLEKPFAKMFDKVFFIKEPNRQKDVKKFWGMIRKKGAIIEAEDNVTKMLRKLNDNENIGSGDLKDYILQTFKTVTAGVQMDSYGLDARPKQIDKEYQEALNDINERIVSKKDNKIYGDEGVNEQVDFIEEFENDVEDTGQSFYNNDFDSRKKKASRIIKRFGIVYNKALRSKFTNENKDKVVDRRKQKLFNRDLFESTIYNLAVENDSSAAFIYNIENSALKEVQAFNRFLNKVHPDNKELLLNSMHFVFSNSKHIVGFRNTISDSGDYEFINSLGQREMDRAQSILDEAKKQRGNGSNKTEAYIAFEQSVEAIRNGQETNQDYFNVLEMLTDNTFNLGKVLEQGYLTFQGVNIPIETLISGFIKKGLMAQNKGRNGETDIYIYNARPLVEALINTNRKFTPLSSVKNAEGNMEPVRITNNHLTKEIDSMVDFLSSKPTKEQFFKKFSHLAHNQKDELGKAYIPNQFLDGIYDNYEKGILPTISQYHGIEDISNNTGSLYKNSTAIEQGIEDFLIFANTSRKSSGQTNRQYLHNMGSFADSPRKFFMNANRIDFKDVFETKQGKLQFKHDGKIINSALNIHNQIYNDQVSGNKPKFKKELLRSIKNQVDFINNNAAALSKIGKMKPYFTNGKLNKTGQELVSEFVINSTVNGYNITETFLPGIKGANVVKRFKMNSSPIMSAKNENFKIEPVFFSDEIINNSIAGTDSGMFITKETAEKLALLGKGVFDMNHGFKLLNASVEKNNPNFKGKSAYLKGYTTVIDETHPLHKILKAREDKYRDYHVKKYGTEPSINLSDGSFNHIAIAIPQSSDKSGFSGEKFIKEENGNLEYTETGLLMTPDALSQNIDETMKRQDQLYYSKKGDFIGIDSYNFGPQQVMDKQSNTSGTPVQMINSVMVNAAINGRMDLAIEIQQHIANQKRANLQKVLNNIKEQSIADYRAIIEKGLNKEDMNQAQRILLEDNGSLSHPYINEIIVNQLAKTIRREGNKLQTPGTYAQQKPDIGFTRKLKSYQKNADGTNSPAEIVLPKHMSNSMYGRQIITISNTAGQSALSNYKRGLSKKDAAMDSYTQDMNALQFSALELAKKRHNVTTGNAAQKFIGKEYNDKSVHIGYHVKGETVMASRVPGHGPSSTGVFEVVGFDNGDGNQVMVPAEFNQIIGSDNDGDALFVQTRAKGKEYSEWNKAFDKITQYWLSEEMSDQVQAKMEFEESTQKVVNEINEQFPKNKEYVMPFSPEQRMKDYNNTMVSKRNVGPVFNIHKIANLLAAYEIKSETPISINKVLHTGFKDVEKGNNSRNQQSAILANIILDNSKHGFADDIGLDEHNIAQATLLVNMGVSLLDVGKILNSPAAKLWSEFNRNNSSSFHDSRKQETIINDIYKKLNLKPAKNTSLKIQTALAGELSQQPAIIEMFRYLSEMNSEVQKISAVMSGHNKIHVNPLVLEKQLVDFRKVMAGSETNKTLVITDEFRSNPDLQNYVDVAEETLKHMKRLNPVYRTGTNKVLQSLNKKISQDMNIQQIEKISKDISKFNTSRLLGLNNHNQQYVKDLMNPNSPNSIYSRLNTYLNPLKKDVIIDENDILRSVSKMENSVLFRQALNMSLVGNVKYISANTSFVNDSFNETERKAAQQEFEELPTELRDDLILYDMIQYGWKGPQSIAPFFGVDTNMIINMASNDDINNKNNDISNSVLRELQKIVALKASMDQNNPFDKVYLNDEGANVDNVKTVISAIYKNKNILSKIGKGQPMYINARKKLTIEDIKQKNFKTSSLYQLEKFTPEEIDQIKTERNYSKQRERVLEIAKGKIKLIPNNMKTSLDFNIALTTIADANVSSPHKTYNTSQKGANMDPLVEATITFEELMRKVRENGGNNEIGMDAREDFDIEMFTNTTPLTQKQYEQAMEFRSTVSDVIKKDMHERYTKQKIKANREAEKILPTLNEKTDEELQAMYVDYGNKDVYAYSIIVTPIVKELAKRIASEQSTLHDKIQFDGNDVSVMQAYMMSGSTIPSNHPAAQGMARMLEREYKTFIGEKRKYISKMNEISNALYKEKLGYTGETGYTSLERIKNTFKRIRDTFTTTSEDIYQRLYGNMTIREESVDANGNLSYNYKLRSEADFNSDFERGFVTQAEKDFYDFFRKTTAELKPKNLKQTEADYIPHTSMSKFEAFSSRGLLGLMISSRKSDEAIYDVKMKYTDADGTVRMMNFKQIEDLFKANSRSKHSKNNIGEILEYRKLRQKALKLLKENKNEDGSRIISSPEGVETALGFGAINRFANNRSVKAKEMPSMDLNKALGDYIHSTLFVNGNDKFKGMERLQGYIDGVLAFNRENNLPNMNAHVQKVWKDYFLRNKRQTSVLGEKADKVILGLTRLNLFYSLGYQANKNTGGLYALGNVLAGKYHNIKDIGGKAWINGELKFWGLDKGFEGGINGILQRRKRMARIMKNINFMEINVYDEVNMEKKSGLDTVFSDLALAPMILSEKWIQQVHMIGMLSEEQLDRFDEEGNYKPNVPEISNAELIKLEDQVKSSHGRGYQPTDQRAIQMYSWGNMMLQFSRFIPTMFHDRFAKEDVNIYGQETIGTLRAVSKMVKYVVNNPSDFVNYRNNLSEEQRKKLDSGLKGMAMASLISIVAASTQSPATQGLFWDTNYYMNYPKLSSKMIPAPIQSTKSLVEGLF